MTYLICSISQTYFTIFSAILVFAVSVLFAGILIPQILLISFRRQLFDTPDERKIHQGTVPRLGGIAFKPVVFLSVALLIGTCQTMGCSAMLGDLGAEIRPLSFAFCSIMVLYLVGMADDLIGIRYSAKFIVQVACGLMAIAGGLWIDDLHGLFLIHALPQWAGYPLTILAVVFIINAVNLIDGIDGLASGLCGVAMLFYGAIFIMAHQYIYAMLAFATLGVLVPFFCYNVFGSAEHGRKIFMGDTGSLTIGMMACVLSLKLLQCFPGDGMRSMPNAFILAYSPLIVPCFDVVRVYLHRVEAGQNPFLPDKNHIHHKLLALGMGQRTAMITIVSVSVLFTSCNILLARHANLTLLLAADVAVWTLANVWLTNKIHAKNSQLHNQ